MSDPVVSIAKIHAKAQRDHAAGKSRDDHGFNWHALCLPTYLAEFDRLAQASPALHVAPNRGACIDLAQIPEAQPQAQGA